MLLVLIRRLRPAPMLRQTPVMLYYQGARSVSEQFFEVDLAALLNLPGHNDGLFPLTDWVEAHIGETLNFYSLPRLNDAVRSTVTCPRFGPR